MIQVKRGSEPETFGEQTNKWWNEFERKRKQNIKYTTTSFWNLVRKRKKMKEYATILAKAFHSKCAFCESNMGHVSVEHVEHYRPKGRLEFYDQMFVWNNWLIACERCNSIKATKFPYCENGQACFIDPSNEDPYDHIDFVDAQIVGKTTRGKITIEEIGLRRADLTKYRKRWLCMVIDTLLLLLICGNDDAKTEARMLLIWSMQVDAPYSAMTRIYLSRKTPRLANPEILHPVIDIQEPLQHIEELVRKYQTQLQQVL